MSTDINELAEAIQREVEQSERVYRENKEAGAPALSTAYDEGRRRGLLDALEIVLQRANPSGGTGRF